MVGVVLSKCNILDIFIRKFYITLQYYYLCRVMYYSLQLLSYFQQIAQITSIEQVKSGDLL